MRHISSSAPSRPAWPWPPCLDLSGVDLEQPVEQAHVGGGVRDRAVPVSGSGQSVDPRRDGTCLQDLRQQRRAGQVDPGGGVAEVLTTGAAGRHREYRRRTGLGLQGRSGVGNHARSVADATEHGGVRRRRLRRAGVGEVERDRGCGRDVLERLDRSLPGRSPRRRGHREGRLLEAVDDDRGETGHLDGDIVLVDRDVMGLAVDLQADDTRAGCGAGVSVRTALGGRLGLDGVDADRPPPSREMSAVRAPVEIRVPDLLYLASAQLRTAPIFTSPEATLRPATRLRLVAGVP